MPLYLYMFFKKIGLPGLFLLIFVFSNKHYKGIKLILKCLLYLYMFFKKSVFLASFCLFSSFQTNTTKCICERCPFSIRCQDSNAQPSDYESPPITTRPGLPPNICMLYLQMSVCRVTAADCTADWQMHKMSFSSCYKNVEPCSTIELAIKNETILFRDYQLKKI